MTRGLRYSSGRHWIRNAASPSVVDLHGVSAGVLECALAAVARSGQAELLDAKPYDSLVPTVWNKPPDSAFVLPITSPGQSRPTGLLVAGVNPRRALDDSHRTFFDLVAGQLATAISNARAHEDERKRAEALAEIDRAKTTFFGNVSHEFRTPLTLMLGPIEELLARNDLLPQQAVDSLTVAHRNSLRLLKLVNTLLDFSRLEAGRVQAAYERTDLAALTTDLASVFRSAIEKAGMSLIVDCPPLQEETYVDRDMWEKIVLNLLSNAFKYTFEGQISVRLVGGGGNVELRVADTGTGIPADELPRMFERFHRIHGARSRTHEGTGIGLALVQELVKLHGGAIHVESEYGKGSSFIVSIPSGKSHLPEDRIGISRPLQSATLGAAPYLQEALRWLPTPPSEENVECSMVNDESEETSLPIQPSQFNIELSARARILLADDNADMRDYVKRLLSKQYEVEAVADGHAALAAARVKPPALVLTDIMMPGLDGFGLLRELRADPGTGTIPIILLSARAGEEASLKGLEAGADDYLIKPFSARELLARVNTHLQMARLRRETEEKLRDLTTRLDSRVKELQTLFDVSPVGIGFTEDADCRRIWANPVLSCLLGIPQGDNASKSASPDEQPAYKVSRNGREVPVEALPMQRAAASGVSIRNEEFDVARPDGSVITILTHAEPLFDGQSKPCGAIFFCVDVTERKQADTKIRSLNEDLTKKIIDYERVMRDLEASRADLHEKVEDLEKFHDVVVGRELKLMELEQEVERLRRRIS